MHHLVKTLLQSEELGSWWISSVSRNKPCCSLKLQDITYNLQKNFLNWSQHGSFVGLDSITYKIFLEIHPALNSSTPCTLLTWHIKDDLHKLFNYSESTVDSSFGHGPPPRQFSCECCSHTNEKWKHTCTSVEAVLAALAVMVDIYWGQGEAMHQCNTAVGLGSDGPQLFKALLICGWQMEQTAINWQIDCYELTYK